ncbi:ABC transporter, permease protein [Thermoclostridium stercorarium subsp. stercorarium DSM 8532]|uniref:ABC transporter, permease protein n=3 Tax=Thermoclostridium stercorarium TaxID=1510 RepID=L7VRD8_THES1|nr:carbohydrate ABC transporter permease [Thermoclostridium stercorarium]AGC68118.1 ABC transporter, permease protein [Thermoclostridium stercorarium subsp. stercorarium DSM 8532]AGI39144.1 ABC transporter permease subunit [Thermoclostridium stercorarium subsp. stercorarium DSM 8532]ANW98499.1 ABC transporter permease [Thermoclostridium stercorarium subsp. thermolacticum DSM 2910]ANX01033.1 ABC transporter permease [Thermoclostridium stercorarium subsp. leptospartum DSM 9219]UZQ86645.1 carbohy
MKTVKSVRVNLFQALNKEKMIKLLKGTNDRQGLVYLLFRYYLLIVIGFIYLYPLFYMVSTSLMSLDDLLDVSINWLPSSLYLDNYINAAKAMDFWNTFLKSIVVAVVPTVIQVCSCAVIGYGFARFEFKGKKLMMAILIFSFILPKQVTMMPTYVLFTKLKLVGSLHAFNLPALLGQGFYAQIFILIFYQFFRQMPKSLIESAQIDGAGSIRAFLKIAIPSAAPAILVVFLFSFVWYWNESYLTTLYISGVGTKASNDWTTLVVELKHFENIYAQYNQRNQEQLRNINESIKMAGTFLAILPLLIMYAFLQKNFVESVDRTGITGE